MELLYSLLGLNYGSPTRLLYDEGIHTTINTLADEAKKKGYLVIPVPFSWLPSFISGPVKYIVLVRDLKMAQQVGNYGTHDPHVRLPFEMTNIVVKSKNITSRHDNLVSIDRSRMKKVLHNFNRTEEVIKATLDEFLASHLRKEINLEESFREIGTRIIGRSILGIQRFPSGDLFRGMVNLLEETDDALTNFYLDKLPLLRDKLEVYSQELLEKNRETLLGENSVFPYIINGNIDEANVATIFLVTANINRLLYLTIIFLGCNPDWQERLREAFREEDEEFLSGFYKEMCRLFIPTQFPRFSSTGVTFQGVEFPPGSLFLVLGRAIRMDPEIYPNPTTCDPLRYKNGIRMNTVELSPFGLGPRQCPASAQFTEKFWLACLKYLFLTLDLELVDTSDEPMEEIHPLISQIILEEEYMGIFRERK